MLLMITEFNLQFKWKYGIFVEMNNNLHRGEACTAS